MILATRVENSIISFGIFNADAELVTSFDVSSDAKKTSDEYLSIVNSILRDKGQEPSKIGGAILASVVPQLTDNIKTVLRELISKEPIVVGPGVKTGFHIKIDDPSELGADMVANTVAAIRMKNSTHGAIVADFGAVTTVSAIGKSGEYIGCAIMPGVRLSLDAMYESAAQLPNVDLSSSAKAIGKNSESSVRAGVLLGNSFAIDGFVAKMAEEMHLTVNEIDLFATGRYALPILKSSKNKFEYDRYLTLNGLCHIFLKNDL